MVNPELEAAFTILLVGCCIISSILIRWGADQWRMPAVVGFMFLGIAIRACTITTDWMTDGLTSAIQSLGSLGIVALMFRVGLESKIPSLLRELRSAGVIWIGDVAVSALFAFVGSRFVLGLPLISCLFITVAMTATSVAISVGVWRDVGQLQTRDGQLILDLAELDDISAIALIALLVAVAPELASGTIGASALLQTGGSLLLRMLGFVALCVLFSRYLERPISEFVRHLEPTPDAMLFVAGTGFLIAAAAGLLGFSIALGAFFAGLVFSRDPEAVKQDTPFEALYDLLTPFFFIQLGMSLDPDAFRVAWFPGLVLTLFAIGGKFFGVLLPAWGIVGQSTAVKMATSMFPRAEIAMVVMHQGVGMGEWAVDASALAMVVVVSAVTSLLSPFVLRLQLQQRHSGP